MTSRLDGSSLRLRRTALSHLRNEASLTEIQRSSSNIRIFGRAIRLHNGHRMWFLSSDESSDEEACDDHRRDWSLDEEEEEEEESEEEVRDQRRVWSPEGAW
eukprot:CAMPEP_0184370226 /NCGR_PEP_ID=MMETSP1089-20130417/162700_1 /TAXON_ID=38269 ORGANISM="Gloeochaete wittrockiana, Strain SAG46.84" /NCGR_SAMPLE_ID=MMETSP1089 /ASSEMBLY_ACC=CAM_ASM_000445 /LENGTH=101 /DNA_ID=CAMNT_0026712797 /DNA_START=986 /DNA_END=1288 /DNA_ORIENTATION=+